MNQIKDALMLMSGNFDDCFNEVIGLVGTLGNFGAFQISDGYLDFCLQNPDGLCIEIDDVYLNVYGFRESMMQTIDMMSFSKSYDYMKFADDGATSGLFFDSNGYVHAGDVLFTDWSQVIPLKKFSDVLHMISKRDARNLLRMFDIN